jgi:hypothetical protein
VAVGAQLDDGKLDGWEFYVKGSEEGWWLPFYAQLDEE